MSQGLRMGVTAVAVVAVIAIGAWAAEKEGSEKPVELKVGDKAPDFNLPKPKSEEGSHTASDRPKKLSDFKGKQNVLIAFYPKADTPGCTKQLCGYRDEFETFKSADTEVVAVSVDEQQESDQFKKKFSMPFTVLGDPNHEIIDAYGVPLIKRGEAGYAQRSVYLVDKEGIVRYIDLQYSIDEDKEPLFKAMAELNKQSGEGKT